MPRTGDKIGPYTLIRKVGRGGFGEVWLAEKKTRLSTTEFALKLAIEENPDIDAIQQEAELWKQASGHPNVLPIIEADIYDEYIVIVSEFARGGSLEDWLKTHQGAAPSIDAAIEMISGILSGLEHLHGLHIIHRDLKPANILLQGNRPRLADFGLARVLKSSIFSQTVAGTPEYMAPEAFLNVRSEQADLWAVGVMLYQLLIGRLPFPFDERMTPWQKMAAITTYNIIPAPLSVPQPLREVIIHSLQKKPEQRYKSGGEMQAAIIEAIESLKFKAKEHTILYPVRPNLLQEGSNANGFDTSLLPPTEPLAQAPAPDSPPIPRPVPTEPTRPSHSDLKPVQIGPSLPVRTEPEVLDAAEAFKPKRDAKARWVSIVSVIVLGIGLVIGIWILIPKPPVSPQAISGPGTSPLPLRGFEFDTVMVDSGGTVTNRRNGQAQYYTDDINGVSLEMVQIPGGTFLMGSADNEPGRTENEGPQHEVSVPTFYMSKYEVTQAQWRTVARLPNVKRGMNPDPSHFKGKDLPVDLVSWEDAVEFCERLSAATGRQYRLPTEAEWEYACRAGTTTPFAFGATITPELVNYTGRFADTSASIGVYRERTTPVGSMGVANAFGLYDMHGNVWEWCLDVWHDNYNNAPTNGSEWERADNPGRQVLRGGSWFYHGKFSRAAFRSYNAPDVVGYHDYGFRVVLAARTR